ncbi:hypothetical protein Tco_0833089 [Tanacetum coccineum]
MRTIENNNVGFTKNTMPKVGLRETFERYLHESYKRQEGLDGWIKLFVQKTDQDLKRHNTAIKSLKERVTCLAHTISINQANQTPITHPSSDSTKSIRQECAMKLEPSHDIPFTKPFYKTSSHLRRRIPEVLSYPVSLAIPLLAMPWGPEDLEEVLMNEDINGDLGNFLKENGSLPNFDRQEAISFSTSSSSEIVKDSYKTSQDSNNDMRICDFEIDDLWDDLDPEILTKDNDQTKPKFFGSFSKEVEFEVISTPNHMV